MAAVKYQVLYKYTNPNANQFITNDSESDYKQTLELYHQDHKINNIDKELKLEAENEKSELIIEGNNTSNDNYGMLFKFTGTKRINKKVWVEGTTGYVIRDKEAVRDKVTRAVDGDYSGEYLLIEGDTIENGVVVAKNNPITATIYITNSNAKNKTFFENEEELKNTIINSTIAQLNVDDLLSMGVLHEFSGYDARNFNVSGVRNIGIKIGYDFSVNTTYTYYGGKYQNRPTTVQNSLVEKEYSLVVANGGRAFSTFMIADTRVQKYAIPAHYEEVAELPYAICDTYERIEQTPWFILSTHSSLTSALEKARAVVKSVGIDNVKIIKVVPTEQFVKIN